jgi:hypothetical protein
MAYTNPHPLVSGRASPPSAPQNLRLAGPIQGRRACRNIRQNLKAEVGSRDEF